MDRKIILFELNEVPLRIIDQFVKWRPKSLLAQKLPQCRVYETHTEDTGNLSPWITWPSLHRGVNDEKHTIGHFGQELQDIDKEFPPIWDVLAQKKICTGICGSLHTYPMPKNLESVAFFIPDTFAASSECFPKKLSLFQEFNLRMARKSWRNVDSKVDWKSALKMLTALPEMGFKLSTFKDVGAQLVNEKLHSWQKVRRRTYQGVLAFDIFMKQLQKSKADFVTFFTNHVASSMHRYWAATFPQDYSDFQFEDAWVQLYRNEIEFTMEKFDGMFLRLVKFVENHPEYLLLIASSMGQEATIAKPLETQLYVQDLNKFMAAMGLEPSQWEQRPAMAPRVSVFVAQSKQTTLTKALASIRINGAPIEYHEREFCFFNIRLGQENLYETDCQIELLGKKVPFAELGLKNVKIDDKSNTTAYHIPQGVLLVYDPKKTQQNEPRTQISALDIAPAILQNFSVQMPSYMKEPAAVL